MLYEVITTLYADWVEEGTFRGNISGTLSNNSGSPINGAALRITSYNVCYTKLLRSVASMPTPNPESHETDSLVTISATEPTWTDHTFTGWLYNSVTYKTDGINSFTMPARNNFV